MPEEHDRSGSVTLPSASRHDPAGSRDKAVGSFNPTRLALLRMLKLDIRMVRGSGCRLYDESGREYLDFLSQYGAVPFGQNPDGLWAVMDQVRQEQLPAMIQPLLPIAAQDLAQTLAEITPDGLEICTFANSGAEAVEAAIKLVRVQSERPIILSANNSFHGKTLGALSATGRTHYQKGFGAPALGFDHVPYGDLEALKARISEGDVAAFIFEPIQGEGGIVLPPDGYLEQVIDLCRSAGVITIVDEIQTGLGRTGTMWALPAGAGTPDILLTAKALGGGLVPIAACICTREVWHDQFGELHSSTFANNNLACRVAQGVIRTLQEADGALLHRVHENGTWFLQQLQHLQRTFPNVIKEVRGRGYMIGVEFHPFQQDTVSALLTICSHNKSFIPMISAWLLRTKALVTAPTFNSSRVLRLQPPLIAGRAELAVMVAALGELCDILDRVDTYALVHHLFEETTPRIPTGQRHGIYGPATTPRPTSRHLPATPVEAQHRFAFIIHPVNDEDVHRSDPSLTNFTPAEEKNFHEWCCQQGAGLFRRLGPFTSPDGSTAEGHLVMLPMLPREMRGFRRSLRAQAVLDAALDLAAKNGATRVGLGGFTSIISGGGSQVQGRGLAITSGSTMTTVLAVQGIRALAERVGLDLATARLAVVGAAGSIGWLASLMLARDIKTMSLIGNPGNPRGLDGCQALATEVRALNPDVVTVCGNDPARLVRDADIVIVATSSDHLLFDGEDLKPGAIVCDVSRPRNIPEQVTEQQPVIAFDGGLARLPASFGFAPIQDLPPGVCWGCLTETMLLALEGDQADYSIGKRLSLAEAEYLSSLAHKHGVLPAYEHWYGKAIPAKHFARVRAARAARSIRADRGRRLLLRHEHSRAIQLTHEAC